MMVSHHSFVIPPDNMAFSLTRHHDTEKITSVVSRNWEREWRQRIMHQIERGIELAITRTIIEAIKSMDVPKLASERNSNTFCWQRIRLRKKRKIPGWQINS